MSNNESMGQGRSALSHLRALIPERTCTFAEALRIAEQQALRLLRDLRIEDAPVPGEVVSEMPRVLVHYRSIPMSGLSYWDGTTWIIALNRAEPKTRQRFTLLHEYKHIIDHGRTQLLYAGDSAVTADKQAERAADFFAGCVLLPRHLLKRAWASGLQTPDKLARHFETSEQAVNVRLAQIGLIDQTDRHGGRPAYQRSGSIPSTTSAKEAAA